MDEQARALNDAKLAPKLMFVPMSIEETGTTSPRGESPNRRMIDATLSSNVIHDVDVNDDDPPPYTAIVPQNHVLWPFDFSSGQLRNIQYSMQTMTPCRAETPLAPFQSSLTSGSNFHPEGNDGQHTSISMPLMPYGILKFGSHRSPLLHRNLQYSDESSITKDDGGSTRRYGGILVGAAVIVFLMALSLLVRFIVEKSFWRG